MKPKPPSLKFVRTSLKKVFHWYKKNWKNLAPSELSDIENSMSTLSNEVQSEKKDFSTKDWAYLKAFTRRKMKKSFFKTLREFVVAIVFAIVVATLIRQMWFELYEIPTGSMRPTLQEKDRLIVSKTDFGINVPITPKQLYFDEDLVHRGGIITFTAEDMDVYDPDQVYFYLFPGKKRLIKRCIGKPGDTLYFYGGKVYGYDKNNQAIDAFLSPSYFPNLVHIPYITFIGKVRALQPNLLGEYKEVTFSQMNQTIGKIDAVTPGNYEGKILVNDQWISDKGPLASKEQNKIQSYGDFWGINNYAMSRIITKKEIQSLYGFSPVKEYGNSEYYLELRHSPSLYTPLLKSHWKKASREFPMLSTLFTFIPIDQEQMKTLFSNVYTSRFTVKNSHAHRYSAFSKGHSQREVPYFAGVPDGTYEYENGIAYEVSLGGHRNEVGKNNPLMQFAPEFTQDLFNTGIEFLKVYEPETFSLIFPQRFSYFNNGDLYVMGRLFMKKDNEKLQAFIQKEMLKESTRDQKHPYRAFVDPGAPLLENGELDFEKIKAFGLKLPEKSYLALGDNYASSGDSRDFGFVPEENLRGGASLIIWPCNERWGIPAQVAYKWITTPNITVWGIVILSILGTIYYQKKQNKKPIYRKLSD